MACCPPYCVDDKIDMSDELQAMFRPCAANRLLLPAQMQDKGIESFLYVDTDILWLEDPATIFAEFAKFGKVGRCKL